MANKFFNHIKHTFSHLSATALQKGRLAALLVALSASSATFAQALGSWRNYLSYNNLSQVCAASDGVVFGVASGDLYAYHSNDGLVTGFDKASGMSGTGISQIAWCKAAKRLVVVYKDANIDLVDTNGDVINLSDYYSYNTTLDKTVNSITIEGRFAYLGTNFGIVKVDVENAVIADTYNLGLTVFDVCQNSKYIIASTDNGLQRASLSDNLLDKSVWKKINIYRFYCLYAMQDKFVIVTRNNANILDPETGNTTRFYQTSDNFANFDKTAGRIVCYGGNKTYVITSPTADGVQAIDHTFSAIGYDNSDGTYWANDADGNLGHYAISTTGDITTQAIGLRPDGPAYNNFGFIFHRYGHLYTTSNIEDADACVQIYDDSSNTWHIYDDSFKSSLNNKYRSSYALDVDPTDTTHLMLATASGVYEFRSGTMVKHYDKDNSPFQPANGIAEPDMRDYTKISAICFDSQGTAWCLNPQSTSTSLFKLNGNQWQSLHHKELMNSSGVSMTAMRRMGEDSSGRLWFTNANYLKSALVCYWPQTDSIKVYSSFVNQDGTSYEVQEVYCWAEDRDGNIWIGTEKGPFYLSSDELASGGTTFTQFKVPRNDGTNLADYLLDGNTITAIAVDGAGRKWMGTGESGVYLISADNIEQIEHFTTDDTPLLSNEIYDMAINPTTGMVYFGTAAGLCSYQSDATTPVENLDKDNIWAYPNPVRPDYTGLVTITGLTYNAEVKILTANGKLVASGRSNGGTFTWDCHDQRGNRVASGVYMVCASTEDGSEGIVCKIAVVR